MFYICIFNCSVIQFSSFHSKIVWFKVEKLFQVLDKYFGIAHA